MRLLIGLLLLCVACGPGGDCPDTRVAENEAQRMEEVVRLCTGYAEYEECPHYAAIERRHQERTEEYVECRDQQ